MTLSSCPLDQIVVSLLYIQRQPTELIESLQFPGNLGMDQSEIFSPLSLEISLGALSQSWNERFCLHFEEIVSILHESIVFDSFCSTFPNVIFDSHNFVR